MSEQTVVVVGHDDHHSAELIKQLRQAEELRNVQIIGATVGLGLPPEMSVLFGAKLPRPKRPEPPPLTPADLARIQAAEEKRQRRAAKLIRTAA